MKNVLFLMLLLLNFGILFGNGSLERDEYLVSMDDSCRDPELLVSSNGDMYFFYINDFKLKIEKKVINSTGFVPIEHSLFGEDSRVKSIKRFRMSDESYTLVVVVSQNGEDSLYVLNFDDNKLVAVQNGRVDNDYAGVITDYNLYSIGYKEFILTYLKSNYMYYTYVKYDEIYKYDVSDYSVNDYALEGSLKSNELVLKGYLLNASNKLFNLTINKSESSLEYVADYGSDPGASVDYYSSYSETDTYIVGRNNSKIFESKAGITAVHDLTSNEGSYYFTYSDTPKVNLYTYLNGELFLGNSLVGRAERYKFDYNELIYLTPEGDLYSKDLMSGNTAKQFNSSVIDFELYYTESDSYLMTVKEEYGYYVIEIFKRDDNWDFVRCDSFTSLKADEDVTPFSIDNNFWNIIYRTKNDIVDNFEVKYLNYDNGEAVKIEVILTRVGREMQLEVIK